MLNKFKPNCLINVARRFYCTVQNTEVLEEKLHVPVMAKEVIKYLQPKSGQNILDMTFGAGGHSREILESAPGINIVTLDRDPIAYDHMQQLSRDYPGQVTPLLGRFSDLPKLIEDNKIRLNSFDSVLFDFGCSSMQFDTPKRGFSLAKEGPLDMRMGGATCDEITAADVLANCKEQDLYKIIKVYGEEKRARSIARAIVEARYLFKRLKTTYDLADLVESVCGNEMRHDKLQRRSHSATKTFQALRIFVNDELNEIDYGMLLSRELLMLGGRLVAISFHSLEDTIVKKHLVGNSMKNEIGAISPKYLSHEICLNNAIIDGALEMNWKCLNKHVIVPDIDEVENNPRSRSAKLRAAVRIK